MPYTSEAERGYVVACHVVANMPIEEIAARAEVDMCPRTIKRWVDRFNLFGFDGLKTKPKTGRSRVTTPEQDAAIAEVVRRNHLLPASTVAYEALADIENVSHSTLYNR